MLLDLILGFLYHSIIGINMAVGVNGLIGKPMIREGQGLHIYVRRSLRDVFMNVSTLAVEIKVGSLHGVMSDKEYDVILNCSYMNIYEEPKLPPSFMGNLAGPKDTIRMLVDKLEGLWVSYRMTSLSETELIPIFSIIDIRPDTRPEMHPMLGSSSDVSKQGSTGNIPIGFSNVDSLRKNLEAAPGLNVPIMLLIDNRYRSSSQSYVVRLQQPRVLEVLDFLLAGFAEHDRTQRSKPA